MLRQLEAVTAAVAELAKTVHMLPGIDAHAAYSVPARLPAEHYVADWLSGAVPMPVLVCTAQQLYRAFLRRWIEHGGPGSPPSQVNFTKTAKRWSECHPTPPLQYRVINLYRDDGARHTVRCWVPAGAVIPDGMSEGEHATAQVDAFELALSDYPPNSTKRKGGK